MVSHQDNSRDESHMHDGLSILDSELKCEVEVWVHVGRNRGNKYRVLYL